MIGLKELIAARRLKNFFATLMILYAIAIALQTLLPSYLNFKGSEALSFNANDGWCTPSLQGIGNHCFGDFYYTLKFANVDHPWSMTANPYPPVSLLLFKPFAYFVTYFPQSHLPLAIYLLGCVLAVLVPTVHAFITRRLNNVQAAAVAAFSIASAPVLMAFDRGNIQLLLIPLLYFFSLGVLEGKTKQIFLFGLLLILFKPQMISLGAVFLINRQWKSLVKWAVIGTTTFLLGFLIYPKGIYGNIEAYIKQATGYQNYGVPSAIAPVNLSIANTWSLLKSNPIFHIGQGTPDSTFYPTAITAVLLVLICINLILIGKARSTIANLFIVLSLPILIPTTTFAYYLCILLPLFILIFADTLSRTDNDKTFLRPKSGTGSPPLLMIFQYRNTALLLSGMFYLLFIPWALPWSLFPGFHDKPWAMIGINWMIGQFFLVGLFISLLMTGATKMALINNRERLISLKLLSHNGDKITQ